MKKVNDGHVHLTLDEGLLQTAKGFDWYRLGSGVEKLNFLALNATDTFRKHQSADNSKCLFLKETFGADGYAGFSLDYSRPIRPDDIQAQVEMAWKTGFDCWKMIEGKPLYQKALGVTVDDTLYDGAYAYAEREQIPIVLHVADPLHMWKTQYESGYLPQEAYKQQALSVLEKHPYLRLVLAHFAFMTDEPERMARLLEQYPNLIMDMTPSPESYHMMEENPTAWRDIILAYPKRFVYGSDRGNHVPNGLSQEAFCRAYSTDGAALARSAFEETGWFVPNGAWSGTENMFTNPQYGGEKLYGLGLPQEIVDQLFIHNFYRVYGDRKDVDYDRFYAYYRYEFSKQYASEHYEEDKQVVATLLKERGIKI